MRPAAAKSPSSADRPEKSGPRQSAPPRDPHANPNEQPKPVRVSVLVVDDDEDARDLLAYFLRSKGIDVRTAVSTEEALNALRNFLPDVIVSDIGMPVEDGYSFVRKIRAFPSREARGVPAIALTAFSREQDKMLALTAGFDAHLSKPIALDQLLAAILEFSAKRAGRTRPA